MTGLLARARRPVVLGWLGVVVLAVVNVVVWLTGGTAAAERAEVVAVASRWAAELTTTDPTRAGESFDRLRAGTTDDFARELAAQRGIFVSSIQHAGVVARGTVVEAGVADLGPDAATVLLVARSEVRNGQVPDGEQRSYRMSVRLAKGDAGWRVSGLEFVP
jgi:Mce-associated membrane protein